MTKENANPCPGCGNLPCDGLTPAYCEDSAPTICKVRAETPEEFDAEACPGCGIRAGEGINPACDDPEGCGYFRAMHSREKARKEREAKAKTSFLPGNVYSIEGYTTVAYLAKQAAGGPYGCYKLVSNDSSHFLLFAVREAGSKAGAFCVSFCYANLDEEDQGILYATGVRYALALSLDEMP